MRDEKRVVTLNDYEQRLMVRGLTDFRNDALRDLSLIHISEPTRH